MLTVKVPNGPFVMSNRHKENGQIVQHKQIRIQTPHIGPECRLFAVKSTSAETGMGVTSTP